MQSWMPRDPQVLWYGNKKESFLQRMEIYIYIYIYMCVDTKGKGMCISNSLMICSPTSGSPPSRWTSDGGRKDHRAARPGGLSLADVDEDQGPQEGRISDPGKRVFGRITPRVMHLYM